MPKTRQQKITSLPYVPTTPYDSKSLFECDEGSIRIIDLDPFWAELLLSHLHPKQRKVDPKHVARIVRALESGTYVWLCDPIRFEAGSGFLIDGQHRCQAVVESGITIPNMPLVELTVPDAIIYIDAVQKIRGPKVVQKMSGKRMTHSCVDAGIILAHDGQFLSASRRALSVPERLAIIEKCAHIDALSSIYSKSRTSGIKFTAGPMGAALACMEIHDKAAEYFFGLVAENRPYYDNGVIQQAETLARWMLRTATMEGRRSGEAYIIESADKSVMAWNAWCKDKSLIKLAPSKNDRVATPLQPKKSVLKEHGLLE